MILVLPMYLGSKKTRMSYSRPRDAEFLMAYASSGTSSRALHGLIHVIKHLRSKFTVIFTYGRNR